MNFRLKSPLYAQLELTENCNHFCNYCYNFWRKDKNFSEENYSLDYFKKFIDQLLKNEVFQLTITGGEPLLRKDILFDLISYASVGIDVSLNTNLSLVNKDIAKRLKATGVRSILGSFISYDRKTHDKISNSRNYDAVINGIECVLSEGISLGINMVVGKENLEDIYETAKKCSELGVNHFFATKLNPSPCKLSQVDLSLNLEETKKSLDELIRAREDFGIKVGLLEPLPHCGFLEERYLKLLDRTCTAGVTWVVVGVDGKIRPCTHIDKTYGSLLEEKLEDIWSRMADWSNESFIPKSCKEDCSEYIFCGGGCRATALCKGNISGEDILMTGPIKERLSHRFEEEIKFNNGDLLTLNKKAKYREEDFGITIYVNPKKIAFLNKDARELLSQVTRLEKFDLNAVALYTQDDPKNFINYLLQKGILHKL